MPGPRNHTGIVKIPSINGVLLDWAKTIIFFPIIYHLLRQALTVLTDKYHVTETSHYSMRSFTFHWWHGVAQDGTEYTWLTPDSSSPLKNPNTVSFNSTLCFSLAKTSKQRFICSISCRAGWSFQGDLGSLFFILITVLCLILITVLCLTLYDPTDYRLPGSSVH